MPKLRTGRHCLELVATVHGRLADSVTDDLTEPADVTRWLAAVGLPASSSSDDALRDLRRLREAIFRLLDPTTGPAPADAALVDAHAAVPAPAVRMHVRAGALVASTDDLTTAQAIGIVARDAIDLLTGPDRDRLHQCEAAHCATFYLGTSGGSPRRWCSSATCGNRIRVAAHRDRRRAT